MHSGVEQMNTCVAVLLLLSKYADVKPGLSLEKKGCTNTERKEAREKPVRMVQTGGISYCKKKKNVCWGRWGEGERERGRNKCKSVSA